jgi:hypothetical protein
MEIDDTIQALVKVRAGIDKRGPQTAKRPDALIADLNDLYIASTKDRVLPHDVGRALFLL